MDIRRRRAPRNLELEYLVPDNGLTILDYLNEDCWRAVLDYVPVLDIIRSEPACKRWQKVVLNYLSHVHIGVQHWAYVYFRKHRNIALHEEKSPVSFWNWTNKLGNSVVTYHCKMEECLKIAGANCPNIEDLTLFKVWYLPPWCMDVMVPAVSAQSSQNFKRLQRLCFFYCTIMSDACVNKLLASNDLEEISILVNAAVTGKCFTDIKSTKLKRFVMKKCSALQFAPLLAAADRLSNLTKLVLKHVSKEISDNVHVLLDRMPELEHLYVKNVDLDCSNESDDPFFESVCKLRNLKFLNASHRGTGEHVEAVARSCTELRFLYLERCSAAPAGSLEALCRVAGARLTALGLRCAELERGELLACIRSCPNLTHLSAPGLWMDAELTELLAAARRDLPAHAHKHARLHIRLYNEGDDVSQHTSREYEDVLRFSSYNHNDRDSDEISE